MTVQSWSELPLLVIVSKAVSEFCPGSEPGVWLFFYFILFFSEICIMKRLHMRNIWEITMATSTSQQVPTTFSYLNHSENSNCLWSKQKEKLDIQQNVSIIKVITGNCWLSLFCASPLQLNYQKIEEISVIHMPKLALVG